MSIRIQCESCQRTFQVPDASVGKQTRCPSCQALIQIKGPDLPTVQVVQVPPARTSPPNPTNQPANNSIFVSCRGCGKDLRAPRNAAGKAIRCPNCQTTISVPIDVVVKPVTHLSTRVTEPKPTAKAAPHSSNPLVDDSLWASIPPANASVPNSSSGGGANPYSAIPSFGSSVSYGGGSPGSSRANREIQYKIIGILMMVWGGLITLGCIVRPIMIAVALSNLPDNAVIDYAKLTPLLVGTAIGIAIGLAIAFAMFQGGSAIFNQSDWKTAKTVAILTAIPCIGSCLFPVGIWACFLIYSEKAKRDFDN